MKQGRDTTREIDDSPERRKATEEEPQQSSPFSSLLHLQRKAGNQAVVHLLESHSLLQTKRRNSEPGEQNENGVLAQVLTLKPGLDSAVQRKEKTSGALTSTAPHVQRAANDGGPASASENEVDPEALPARALIVADDATTLASGQMRKSEFLEQLRSTVCTTADAALAEAGQSTAGCPYIEQWLSYYTDQEPAHIERALRKYAPEANSAATAADYIPAVSNRVREAVQRWARTGEVTGVPPELAGMLPGGGGVLGALAGIGRDRRRIERGGECGRERVLEHWTSAVQTEGKRSSRRRRRAADSNSVKRRTPARWQRELSHECCVRSRLLECACAHGCAGGGTVGPTERARIHDRK